MFNKQLSSVNSGAIVVSSFIFLISSLSFAAWNPEQEKVVKDYGEKAFSYFHAGDFSQAIYMWQEILKIDPSQTQPPKLIKQAREKLQEKLNPLFDKFYDAVKKGEYADAQAVVGQIITMDPANPEIQTLSSNIDDIVKIVPDVPTSGRVPNLIRMGISKYLTTHPDIKRTFNALRYAHDLESDNAAVNKLLAMLDEDYPEESRMTYPSLESNVLDHKLALSLSYFYQGRFDLTVQECREVLELDPSNKVALSRLGSGYYALGKKSKAKQYWEQALKLDPANRKLQKMLASVAGVK